VRLLQRELDQTTNEIAESLIARADAWSKEAVEASKEGLPLTFSNAQKPTPTMYFYLKSMIPRERSVYLQVDVKNGQEEGLEYVLTTLVSVRVPSAPTYVRHPSLRVLCRG
ncbi:MAG: hypothetical protein NTZ61_05045, partial [Proteobacteria bacterium]|nr:hypothetical protein [Pseudomonadota bacterium]